MTPLDFIMAAETGEPVLDTAEFLDGCRRHAAVLQSLQGSWQRTVAFMREHYPEAFEVWPHTAQFKYTIHDVTPDGPIYGLSVPPYRCPACGEHDARLCDCIADGRATLTPEGLS